MMASIQKRPNGKYLVRWRNEDNKERSKQFDLKRDAKLFEAKIEVELARGTYVDPKAGDITLQEFYDEWSERQVWSYNTQRTIDNTISKCDFAKVPLNKIRKSHMESWIKAMSKEYAQSTIVSRVQHVRTTLQAAIDDGLIAVDPSKGVRVPRAKKSGSQMRIPDAAVLQKIINVAEDWLQPYIALCAFAGLRRGEACAVQVGDIDFLNKTIHVQRQIQDKPPRSYEIRAPKWDSYRVVHVPEDLIVILSKHVRNIGVFGNEQWLFPGAPMKNSKAATWWDKAAEAAGVEGVTLHDLRHFYASGLIAAGCDVVTVQKAMGHASPSTTLNIYSHLWPDANDRTRKAASGLMQDVYRPREDYARTEKA